MNKTKIALGSTAAAAALITAGIAAPAIADDSTSIDTSRSTDTSLEAPVVVAPEVGTGDVLAGGVLNGGLLNGSAIASGNDTASGNTVTAPVASG
ncbi:hypothetical protein FJ656_15470, partial [Schumannella luteola]